MKKVPTSREQVEAHIPAFLVWEKVLCRALVRVGINTFFLHIDPQGSTRASFPGSSGVPAFGKVANLCTSNLRMLTIDF